MTTHAVEEMEADGLTVFDVEHGVLTGRVAGRQRDPETREWKYVLQGLSLDEENLGIVAKIGATGRLVVITVYLL